MPQFKPMRLEFADPSVTVEARHATADFKVLTLSVSADQLRERIHRDLRKLGDPWIALVGRINVNNDGAKLTVEAVGVPEQLYHGLNRIISDNVHRHAQDYGKVYQEALRRYRLRKGVPAHGTR